MTDHNSNGASESYKRPDAISQHRPFTLQEALPYSPHTSVVPFAHDLIPEPLTGSGHLTSSISELFNHAEFEKLNLDALSPDPAIYKPVKLVGDVLLHDLKSSIKTAYKFKNIKRVSGGSNIDALPSQSLSPFSRAIFDKVSNLFNYQSNNYSNNQSPVHPSHSQNLVHPIIQPSPNYTNEHTQRRSVSGQGYLPPLSSRSPAQAPRLSIDVTAFPGSLDAATLNTTTTTVPVKQEQSIAPSITENQIDNAAVQATELSRQRIASVTTPQAVRKKSNFEIAIPLKRPIDVNEYVEIPEIEEDTHSEDEKSATMNAADDVDAMLLDDEDQRGGLTIELKASGNFNRDEYVTVAESFEAPINLSKKKKNKDVVVKDLSRDMLDQKQRAHVALTGFEGFINDTFDAVSAAIAGNQGSENVSVLNSEQEPTLTTPTHQTTHTMLTKLITLGSFEDADIESLIRLQRLSDSSIKDVLNLDLKVSESWDAGDIQKWLSQIPFIENGLRAARTAVRIMSGGREDKQLYSETVIQHSIDLFKGIMDGVIVPIVELRSSGPQGPLFKLLSPHRKTITPLFTNTQRLFELLTILVGPIELSDTVINALEYTASKLIFVENAHTEKDSVIGMQRFDGLRLVAMNMLCQIFILKPEQRQGILTEILTSLEKLPVGKQSARHFKLSDGTSVQPVSALIMRLIQSSSGKIKDILKKKSVLDEVDADDSDDIAEATATKKPQGTIRTEEDGAAQPEIAIKELDNTLSPLYDITKNNANFVVNFIVSRALSATKSGDTPYRNLLDLFVEDFTACLDSPEWPASELLLRMIMFRMVKLSEAERAPAPAKNMALDVLGTMGASISKLRFQVRKIAGSIEGSSSDELMRFLSDIAYSSLNQRCRVEDIVSWAGPYRTVLEFLEGRQADDPYLKGALSFIICDWSCLTVTGYRTLPENETNRLAEFGALAYRLRMMMEDERWLTNEYSFKTVIPSHAKLGHFALLLRSPLCESFPTILNIVLGSMASDQATVRSKSLKSVNQILETDPAILDGDSVVIQLILKCAGDSSPQVRDSAVGLIGKCISMRPNLEDGMIAPVIERFTDSGVGVRKRAMKLARDIYLRNLNKTIRGNIASGLLLRVQDPDEGVRDLAKQMMEEVWFVPFYNVEDSAEYQTSLTDHVSLMIRIVKSGNVAGVLDKVLNSILSTKEGKPVEGPFGVCTKLVANMFGLIDNLDSDDPSIPAGRDALMVLMIFAKAEPKLFTFEQVRLLKPHLTAIKTREDLLVFRAVTAIYRKVLPNLSKIHTFFLQEVRVLLNQSVSKIQKPLLDNTMACMWIIADITQTISPISRLAASCMAGAQAQRNKPLDVTTVQTFSRYALLTGMIGKHCQLEGEIDFFREKFPNWKGKMVSSLMIDILLPFSAKERPMAMRSAALDAIGLICESSPRNYVSPNVYTIFQRVFDSKIPQLETMILSSFKEFLLTEERRSEAATAEAPAGKKAGKKRELTVMGGTSFDDVASATTQRFLKDITRITLSTQDEHAFLAMEVLGSINRQGLVHPKETGVTLITLETSDMHKLAEVAFQEHKLLHQKHETVLEREYSKAIQSAFNYQCDICKNDRGARPFHGVFQPKLHLMLEVMKISKSKNRQKFFEKLLYQVDFDLNKLNVSGNIPNHVIFSRFIIDNLGFFEYITVGEVLATVNLMEKIVQTTGAPIAQAIESDVFNMNMDALSTVTPASAAPTEPTFDLMAVDKSTDAPSPSAEPDIEIDIEPKRLKQMVAAATILTVLWEARTHLRRLHSLGLNRRESKIKHLAKDLSKTPIKIQGVTGDKLWEELTKMPDHFSSRRAQIKRLKEFVSLMNIDSEFKVDNEDEEMGEGGASHSDDEDEEQATENRGRKRKGASLPGGGGRKKRARSNSKPRPRGRPRKNPLPEPVEPSTGDVADRM